MFDAKLFRRLLGEDDPTGWLVAMDMLEETPAGEGHTYDVEAMTSMWRTRAAWWPWFHRELARALASSAGTEHGCRVGESLVHLIRQPQTIHVTLEDDETGCGIAMPNGRDSELWLVSPRDPKYHRKRLFRLIDALAAIHGGGSGGADSTPQ